MRRTIAVTLLVMLTVGLCSAQTAQRRIVRTTGDASISGTPDQARVVLAVETRAETAQLAASQNAAQTAAVFQVLRNTLGSNGEFKTINYSLTPVYNYPPSSTPVLTGFSAVNSIEVTMSSIPMVGSLLDAATQGGANRIESLAFTLKDPEPFKAQALRLAVLKARSHAEALVGGIGLHLGNVVLIQEGGNNIILPAIGTSAGTSTPTPIQPGPVQVYAQVTLEVEIQP